MAKSQNTQNVRGRKHSIEEIKAALDYDPVAGTFTWKFRKDKPKHHNSRWVGKIAGRTTAAGYRGIRLDGVHYYNHHLAWAFVHGEWPAYEIDHIHGVSAGDAIDNLRPATSSQNKQNICRRRDNTSGVKGVCWDESKKRWIARINQKFIGRFINIEDAACAYAEAAIKFHGEFHRLE